ncbi:MAG: hypothetical protein KDK78_08805, partial [Chlamydiia bacterium]|nr:hypothetical protein [Chlamydiia bacterium]
MAECLILTQGAQWAALAYFGKLELSNATPRTISTKYVFYNTSKLHNTWTTARNYFFDLPGKLTPYT